MPNMLQLRSTRVWNAEQFTERLRTVAVTLAGNFCGQKSRLVMSW